MGVVSASGASTITVAFTGSHSGDELMAQEYSAGAGATWSTGATGSTSSSTSTVTFPSLTPAGAGELYLGFAQVDGGGEAGSTPGFSYTITSAEASVLCWDTNVSATTSPTATQTATGSDSVGALFAASGGGGGTTTTTAPTTTTTSSSTTTTGATTTTVPTGTTTTTVPSTTTTTSVSGSGATTPLLWAGQYQDPTTGLYYMRARWYDPSTGEFLSVDPDFNETLDAYGYADENPLDGTDPSGLMLSAGGAGICNTVAACDATKPTPPKTTTPTKTPVKKTANPVQTAQKQVASAVATAVAAEQTGNQAAIAKADAAVQTAANTAATATLKASRAPNPGPAVDCGGQGQSLSATPGSDGSSQLANAEIIFAAATGAGLTDNEAVQMVAASCQESGLDASNVNGIGAAGLFQLYYSGYQSKAEQLGGIA